MTRALVLGALLAAGCQPTDPVARLEACSDADCRLEAVLPAWDEDPEACWRAVTTQPDELVRAALVAAIAAERPGALEGRCADLPRGGSQERCSRLTRRPHLRPRHKKDPRPAVPVHRPAAGPTCGALPLPDTLDAITPADCGELPESECAFLSAERLMLAEGLPALERSLGLCARSDFGPDCAEHVLELAMPGVPPADAVGPDALEAATAAVARFGEAAGSPVHAQLYEDWFWSVWTATAVLRAERPTGELLEALPAAAAPHLRFAVAWRLLWDDPAGPGFELEPLAAQVEAALAERRPSPSESGPLAPATIVQTRHGWNGDLRTEKGVAAAWCMGSTRRAIHEDPALDLRLAVLEALARQPKPPDAEAFLGLVGTDQPEVLRWAGARLGAMLDPQAAWARGEALAGTETPLVLGRLEKREGGGGPGGQ